MPTPMLANTLASDPCGSPPPILINVCPIRITCPRLPITATKIAPSKPANKRTSALPRAKLSTLLNAPSAVKAKYSGNARL